jgi:hypothetical protein
VRFLKQTPATCRSMKSSTYLTTIIGIPLGHGCVCILCGFLVILKTIAQLQFYCITVQNRLRVTRQGDYRDNSRFYIKNRLSFLPVNQKGTSLPIFNVSGNKPETVHLWKVTLYATSAAFWRASLLQFLGYPRLTLQSSPSLITRCNNSYLHPPAFSSR